MSPPLNKIIPYRRRSAYWRPGWQWKNFKEHRMAALQETHPAVRSLYAANERRLFKPVIMTSRIGNRVVRHTPAREDKRDYILNCLEWSHGQTYSGIGNPDVVAISSLKQAATRVNDKGELVKAEVDVATSDEQFRSMVLNANVSLPHHILSVFDNQDVSEKKNVVKTLLKSGVSNRFVHRKLYNLCYEHVSVWDRAQRVSTAGDEHGIFPYIDENAVLMQGLSVPKILNLRHRPTINQHPKWQEYTYWKDFYHGFYLRRRRILREEVVQRLALATQANQD